MNASRVLSTAVLRYTTRVLDSVPISPISCATEDLGSYRVCPVFVRLAVPLIIVVAPMAAGCGGGGPGRGGGVFVPTGSMTAARDGHTATLLPNGTVLVAGGASSGTALASAELYDPATGTFTATGSMSVTRMGHTATLLPNGKVLIAGGDYLRGGAEEVLVGAELYDSAAGAFTATGSMTVARDDHTATLLSNGTVFIAGGGNRNAALTSTEVYDPAAGIFTANGSMSVGGELHTATLLPNGTVLVTGGFVGGGFPLANAEL